MSTAEDSPKPDVDSRMLAKTKRRAVIRLGRRALLETLLRDGRASADDVRDAVELPPGIDPKTFGDIPGPLHRAGVIQPAGYVKTTRPVAHRRPITDWELVDRAAAERWLKAHPAPDPNQLPADVQRLLFPMKQNEPPATAARSSDLIPPDRPSQEVNQCQRPV
jgi:hypothetical protein